MESDRWTALQYGRGAQMMVMLSVFVGRGVRVDVRRRAGVVVVVGTGAVTVMTLGYSERLGWSQISRRGGDWRRGEWAVVAGERRGGVAVVVWCVSHGRGV